MKILKISIRNFRLLRDVTLSLEETSTVVVGRNNSGKTSLTELFRRLLVDKSPSFRLEDFSCAAHIQFWTAYGHHFSQADAPMVRSSLPLIEVVLTVDYSSHSASFGSLGQFIVDLDPTCSTAQIAISYQLEDGKVPALFEGCEFDPAIATGPERTAFFRMIKERLTKLYHVKLEAVDPNDSQNRKSLDWSHLPSLLQSGFINAQRWLDDTTHRENDVLGKVLESLFRTARSEMADEKDQKVVESLDSAVEEMQTKLDDDFNNKLQSLLPALSLFGYPGLNDPRLRTETTLDVQRLLINHTKVRYEGTEGNSLPEAYNGLGARNLIFILLQLLEFFKSYQASAGSPGIHLVFIEEPEAHLHPQMAEVFIRKLEEIKSLFATMYNDGVEWPVQFVVSTHSSHLANETRFESIRYFLATSERQANHLRETRIKDLRQGLSGTPQSDRDFLHQYMTLTRCDLFFADKAVLIEGCSERLLLPAMIKKCDASESTALSNQYVSIVEVCGAYAHLFFDLLTFLELRTLIITDLDSAHKVQKRVKNKTRSVLEACLVADGSHTTNACIKSWFLSPDIQPDELIGMADAEKTRGLLRVAYEIPESPGGPCGRTFEDAFILANPVIFKLSDVAVGQWASSAYETAGGEKKTEFALRYAFDHSEWKVPRYILDGLRWLSTTPEDSALSSAATAGITPVNNSGKVLQ